MLGRLAAVVKSGQRPKVGLDLDGTVADVHLPFVEIVNALPANVQRGARFTVEDITDFDLGKTKLGLTDAYFMEQHDILWMQAPERILPLASRELVRRLASESDLRLLTRRKDEHYDAVSEWFAKHYLRAEPDIVKHTADKLTRGYTVIFDDAPKIAAQQVELLRSGKAETDLVYVERPWGRGKFETTDGLEVVRHIDEGLRIALDTIAKASV
ncbi:MAG: hypothetical protein M1160_00220 [Candidatus Marsarchaeota archaeon]|jgi:hypothetical protein|nr:hypothetical protein [Candidatus Marsarchaeota archaeon]MCL5111296.1 hypothetical protein [Candidatus Marsarchaeota archaeon]